MKEEKPIENIPEIKVPQQPTIEIQQTQKPPIKKPEIVSPRNSPADVLVISPRKPENKGIEESKGASDWKRPSMERLQSKILAGGARANPIEEEEEEETKETEESGDDGKDVLPYNVGVILYSYTRTSDVEIDVTEGQSVYILETSDPDWTYIGFNGNEGFVPANYLRVCEPEELTPRNTEEKSQNQNQPQVQAQSSVPEKSNNIETTSSTLESNNTPEVELRENVPRDILSNPAVSKLQRPGGEKGRKSAFGSFTSFGSTLRGKKKKKASQEFTISRSETSIVVGPSSLSKQASPSSSQILIQDQNVDVEQPVESTPPPSNVNQRTKIANEILSTEANYVNIIESMINVSFN